MKFTASALVCALLAVETPAFLVESDGLQSWGAQEAPTHWERADAVAGEQAAWMPKSNKRRRVDIEFEHRHIRGHSGRKPTQTANGNMKGNAVPVAKWLEEPHLPLPRELPSVPEGAIERQTHQPPRDLPEDEELAPIAQPAKLSKAVLKPRFAPEHFASEELGPDPAQVANSTAFERSMEEMAAWAARPSNLTRHTQDPSVYTSNEIPLEVAKRTGGDEGPELAHTTRTSKAAHELHKALKKLKAEVPLRVSTNATRDEGPEVGQTIRRVAVAKATRDVQKLTRSPSNDSEVAALTTTAPLLLPTPVTAFKSPPQNQSVHQEEVAVSAVNGSLSAALTCVCGGAFKEGERVTYMGHSFPPGRTVGTIMGGTNNGFLNVEWDHFTTGHSGNCKRTSCGSCIESTIKSRWFTSCGDLTTEKPAMLTTTAQPPLSAPAAPLNQNSSNQLVHREEIAVSAVNATSSAALACVCGGTFKEGDRVKYAGHAFPPGRTFGTILGGTKNGFLNVDWDNFSTGHSGNCKLTTCGSCIESPVKSRWFTACKDLAMTDAKQAK